MGHADWETLIKGKNCPLCAPRPASTDGMQWIATLSVASLYLNRSQTYRGACILVYDAAHITRIDQLSSDEWLRFAADMHQAQQAIVDVVSPDHVNTESLGNVVPHLHFHIVPRYRDDGRWRDPIWLTRVSEMPARALPADQFDVLLQDLRESIDRIKALNCNKL